MKTIPRDCPCHSGLRYRACCAPLHVGELEAPSPERLMRSRYAAFALGLGEYLVATLASSHPDRVLTRDWLVRELSSARERQRFLGLSILHTASAPPTGEVLFYARVFERGADRSFAELSQFVQERAAWKYASGVILPRTSLPTPPECMTRETFARIVGETGRT